MMMIKFKVRGSRFEEECPLPQGEQGYMLLGLIVAIFIITLALGVAASKAAFAIRREREVETVRRGNQYVRAIREYYVKYQHYPGSIEQLENTNMIRFLRQAVHRSDHRQGRLAADCRGAEQDDGEGIFRRGVARSAECRAWFGGRVAVFRAGRDGGNDRSQRLGCDLGRRRGDGGGRCGRGERYAGGLDAEFRVHRARRAGLAGLGPRECLATRGLGHRRDRLWAWA